MSREIKFRAWNKTENRMEYEGHFHFDKDGIVGLEQGVSWWGRLNLIPMQFTGLKDKNGKEIYEGDILRGKDYPFINEGLENYFVVVAWDDETARFYSYPQVCSDRVRGMACGDYVFEDGKKTAKRFKVIGNVYENPELLKEEK